MTTNLLHTPISLVCVYSKPIYPSKLAHIGVQCYPSFGSASSPHHHHHHHHHHQKEMCVISIPSSPPSTAVQLLFGSKPRPAADPRGDVASFLAELEETHGTTHPDLLQCSYAEVSISVEPPIINTPNEGHNRNIISL